MSQFSLGVLATSVTAVNTTITGLSIKLAGFDLTQVGMKILS